jgi:pimeloyl-ACP methyl ester carboxylesterase
MRVPVGDLEIEVDVLGDPSAPPLLMIMGLGAQLVYWPQGLCELLVASGLRVIRYDNRDVGLSSHLPHLGAPNVRRRLVRALVGLRVDSPYSLQDMARDGLGVLDALGIERAHVIGISMGGMIAQCLALLAPKRVLTLTSLSSSPQPINRVKLKALSVLLSTRPRTRDEGIDFGLRMFEALRGPRFPFDQEEHRRVAARAFDRAPPQPGASQRQLSAILAGGSRRTALKTLAVPTLVVHGTADPLIPVSAGRATARAIPNAKLHLIEGLGHHLPPGMWEELQGQLIAHVRDHTPVRAKA